MLLVFSPKNQVFIRSSWLLLQLPGFPFQIMYAFQKYITMFPRYYQNLTTCDKSKSYNKQMIAQCIATV